MRMKNLSLVVIFGVVGLLMCLITVSHSQAGKELPFEIVGIFPAPGPSPRDLTWDGHAVWVGDDVTATLYRMDPNTGQVNLELPLARIQGMPDVTLSGLAWQDRHLMVADSESLVIYAVDPSQLTVDSVLHLLKFKRTKDVRSIALTKSMLSGLTSDGKHLWATFTAGYASSIYQISHRNDLFTKHFWAAGRAPMDLAWTDRSLWVVDGASPGRIYMLTTDGEPTGAYIPSPGDSPTGLAFDGINLWNADRKANAIYRILLR